MSTKAQITKYCQEQLHMVFPSTHTVSYLHMSTLEWIGIGAVAIYFIGRAGIPAIWSDLTSMYSIVRGWFTKTPTATAPVTVAA